MNDVRTHDVDGLAVVTTLRDDEVSKALGGLDELLVHGLKDVEIAVNDHLSRSATLNRVALNDAYESLVVVGVDKDLEIHEVTQFLVPKSHNALNDNDLTRLHMNSFFLTIADEITIGRLLDGLPVSQGFNLLCEQFPIEGIGVIEVDFPAFLHGEMGGVVVVRILRNESHLISWHTFDDFTYNGSFSRTSTACDAYDIHNSIDFLVIMAQR